MPSSQTKSVMIAQRLGPAVHTAINILFRALTYARQAGTDTWQFAEELADLRAAGVTHADLRWLLSQGFVLHAAELTRAATRDRMFRELRTLALPENTCFVLTEHGEAMAKRILSSTTLSSCARDQAPSEPAALPRWCPQRRALWVQDKLVKMFRRPAQNQETILSVFQETGWPTRIDDPLTRLPERDPVLCLHYTIHHLNRNQINRLIRFHGDGTGQGVSWTYAVVTGHRL